MGIRNSCKGCTFVGDRAEETERNAPGREEEKEKEKKEKTRNFALEKRTNKEGRRKGRETPSSPYVVALKEHSGLGMEMLC